MSADHTRYEVWTSTGPAPLQRGQRPAWICRARFCAAPSGTRAATDRTPPLLWHLALQNRSSPCRAPPKRIVVPQYAHDAMGHPPLFSHHLHDRRRAGDLVAFHGLEAAAEAAGEELLAAGVEVHAVVRPREAVAFVGIDHVRH